MSSGFHFEHQRDAMQCGVACLAMACSALGKRIDPARIEKLCCPTTQGVSLKAMADAAASLGLKASPARIPIEYLEQAGATQVILHWNQNHFVLLRKAGRAGRSFLIADPAMGLCRYSRQELLEHWVSQKGGTSGIALLLESTEEFEALTPSTPSPGRSLTFLMGYMKPFRKHLAVVIATLAIGCLLQLIFPFLTQAIVDKGIASRSISLIWLILLGELLIVAGRTSADFLRRRLLLKVSMKANIRLVADFFIKLMRLPMSFFDTKLMGDLLQRMNDHGRVQSFLTGQALSIAFTLLSLVAFGVVLLCYSALIFGVFAAGGIIYGAWIASFLRRRKVLDYELFDAQSRNQNRTYQLITTMPEIKLQDCRERRRREWEDVQTELLDIQSRSLNLSQTQQGGAVFINEVTNIIITVLSATAVIHGSLTLGGMLAIQFVVGQLSSPVEQLMSFIYSMQDVRISLERISDIRSREDECSDDALSFTPEMAQGDIEVKDVSFRYDPHNPRFVLKHLNLVIPQGKVTAIVGASGSGKTTLLKLLLGYYAPEAGSILIAGTSLHSLHFDRWREQCGVVMQEGVIFSDTIERNIAAADGSPDPARVEQAARIACLHDMVSAMPLGYNTKVGPDGVGLSLGQKQRLLIARAVYRNPRYILLDEATNSLDATNERAIVEHLADFYRGRTVVVVAHRLSTVRSADNIVVLKQGAIAEQGSHEELVERRGAYYELVKNQLELGS